MTMIYAVSIADRIAALRPGNLLTLNSPDDPGSVFASIVLARGAFLRLINHDHIRVGECPWSGSILARVAMGFESSQTDLGSPVIVIWHPLCHCAKVWIGDRRQYLDAQHVRDDANSPNLVRQDAARAWLLDQGAQGSRQMLGTLSDEVLADMRGVPRILTVRDRLEWLAGKTTPVRIIIVSEVDQPLMEFLDLFRQLTLGTEVDVEVFQTGQQVVERLDRLSGASHFVILRINSRFTEGQEVADVSGGLELLQAEMPSGRQIREAAYFIGLDTGDSPDDVEVLRTRCDGMFTTSGAEFTNMLHRILDLAAVPPLAAM